MKKGKEAEEKVAEKDDKKRLVEHRARSEEIYRHSGNFSPLEMISSGKAKKYSSRRELWGYVVAVMIVIAVILLLVVVAGVFFRVDSVTVTNETDFSAAEVIAASGIRQGQNLLLTDKDEVAGNIAAEIPFASDITVKKIFPTKIKISLSKINGKYYTQLGRYYYVLSDECTVVAKTSKIEDIELMGCIRFQSSKISECIMGEKIKYRDIDMQNVFDELVGLLEKYDLMGFCGDIILDSKFDITFTYKDRFTVKLGDLNDLEIKFQFLEKIMADLSDTDSGIINVSDKNLHEGIVTLYS